MRPFVFSCVLYTIICAFALLASSPARAADTVETWDAGATNVDFYLGAEGLGLSRAEQTLFSDIMIGYGIIDRLSVYLGTTFTGDGKFRAGTYAPYTGVFGTVVESAVVDLDLFFQVCLCDSAIHVAPSFELNLDADPDHLSWSLYLRGGLDVGGADDHASDGPGDLAWAFDATAGACWTVHDGHQLLVELDLSAPLAGQVAGERRFELGGLALGYNVVLNDAIELINQVWFDLPQEAADPAAVAMTTGFIATLP